jgi:hypothetical protein
MRIDAAAGVPHCSLRAARDLLPLPCYVAPRCCPTHLPPIHRAHLNVPPPQLMMTGHRDDDAVVVGCRLMMMMVLKNRTGADGCQRLHQGPVPVAVDASQNSQNPVALLLFPFVYTSQEMADRFTPTTTGNYSVCVTPTQRL